ncbi:MAG TPA: cytochrome c, partial [Gemmatimonadaceae bacterium]|nr:cytochrome c [Gemmatimonadaceae bacterium]
MKTALCLAVALIGTSTIASAQQAPDGAATFNRACATCHREGLDTAPTPTVLRQLTPEGIVNSLTNGRMQVQGASL